MSLRAISAIVLCKALRFVSRLLRRGGTAMPGRFALRLCPDLLSRLARGVTVAAITGTNGKTTSARMLEEACRRAGLDYFANRSGANLISGVTTEFVMNATLLGKMKKSFAVIECDEAAAKTVFPQLRPRIILVTNLFRDQLDRFGEVSHTLDNIRSAIQGAPEATLCLNADCSLTASLAGDLPNKAVFYGLEAGALPDRAAPELSDAAYCLRCKSAYVYDYVTYGHLGGFRCPRCGYRRPRADYAVTQVPEQRSDGSSLVMDVKGKTLLVELALPAAYNIYNAAGALAAAAELGLSPETAAEALASFSCGFGRMERFDLAGGCRLMLVKNPAGCDQVLEFLQNVKEKFILVLCLNDRSADGTDVSWIWDADFESLAALGGRLSRVFVCGDRAGDMLLRLKYAGLDLDFISRQQDYAALVEELSRQSLPVYIMPTYTAMLELRRAILRRCGGAEFWE